MSKDRERYIESNRRLFMKKYNLSEELAIALAKNKHESRSFFMGKIAELRKEITQKEEIIEKLRQEKNQLVLGELKAFKERENVSAITKSLLSIETNVYKRAFASGYISALESLKKELADDLYGNTFKI